MPKRDTTLFKPAHLRKATWLALLSLAWMQLALAGHQFEHAAAGLADTCHICAQLDRLDDTVAESPVPVVVPFLTATEVGQEILTLTARTIVRHFNARAPPKL